MNTITTLSSRIKTLAQQAFTLTAEQLSPMEVTLNATKDPKFGDLSCNAAMILARSEKKNPRELALSLQEVFQSDTTLSEAVDRIEIVGPGFINFFLNPTTWQKIALEVLDEPVDFFKPGPDHTTTSYHIEIVSANPTGPLHVGHGRGAIIADVLGRVLKFLGNRVELQYYINDSGAQVSKLAASLKARCEQEVGMDAQVPEDGYKGEYLKNVAKDCVKEYGKKIVEEDEAFFKELAINKMMALIKSDMAAYNIKADSFFSERTLHDKGFVKAVIDQLTEAGLTYHHDNALWFKATEFGDNKDRVIVKSNGTPTYVIGDIAYHKYKFDAGFEYIVDVFGQDHHSYVTRLKAMMETLGFSPTRLLVTLVQIVSIKKGEEALKMSKRSGTFVTLRDIIDTVGVDVARYFYLNRKAEAHLDFDLDAALKKTDENPVFYIQYAYVRTGALLNKAKESSTITAAYSKTSSLEALCSLTEDDRELLRKILQLSSVLSSIERTQGTHTLAYYLYELAAAFHSYYARNKIIDENDSATSHRRLLLVNMVRDTIGLCLDLLGLSKPQKM